MSFSLCGVREFLTKNTKMYTRAVRSVSKSSSGHVYFNLFPWKTKSEFCEHLKSQILHNQNGLIAINKPFGVGIESTEKRTGKENVVQETVSATFVGESKFYVKDVTQELAEAIGIKELRVIKAPERYCSGVMLLSSSKVMDQNFITAVRHSYSSKYLPYAYRVVTSGIPQPFVCEERVGVRMVETKLNKDHDKQPIIEKNYTKTKIVNGEVKEHRLRYSVLERNSRLQSALIELAVQNNKSHFIRVYAAHKASPILGDHMYASRVKWVLGKPVIISPFNSACYNPVTLPPNVPERLQINQCFIENIPSHIHLHRVTFTHPNFSVDIMAPLPPYFSWTCQQLDLLPSSEDSLQEKSNAQ